MKIAELRRANEELVEACKQLDTENQLLRAKLKHNGHAQLPMSPAAPKALSEKTICPGQFVDYIDNTGFKHLALVKNVLDEGALQVKVYRTARPDLVITLQPSKDEKQRNCWRRRT